MGKKNISNVTTIKTKRSQRSVQAVVAMEVIMTKKDKKGVPTKTDGKTILEQVPSDKMDDFVKALV